MSTEITLDRDKLEEIKSHAKSGMYVRPEYTLALCDRIKELEARVKSEDEVRNAKPHDAFDALDIDYLCMLSSHGSAVVRAGWLKTFAKKIKIALGWQTALEEIAEWNVTEGDRMAEIADKALKGGK